MENGTKKSNMDKIKIPTINDEMVAVLPETEEKKHESGVKWGKDVQDDFKIGTILRIGNKLKKEGYPFFEGEIVHYAHHGGHIVHLRKDPKKLTTESNSTKILILTKESVLSGYGKL